MGLPNRYFGSYLNVQCDVPRHDDQARNTLGGIADKERPLENEWALSSCIAASHPWGNERLASQDN